MALYFNAYCKIKIKDTTKGFFVTMELGLEASFRVLYGYAE